MIYENLRGLSKINKKAPDLHREPFLLFYYLLKYIDLSL